LRRRKDGNIIVLIERRNEKNSTPLKNEENWRRDGAKRENTNRK
jgi:hypothetical protein